ncbi:MAG TPA: hypothetical protein VMU57_22105 [Edaphobacter sp.]|uniref:hypothetical protein n=1 Tax=Edaphobacter sp. TaxID=1934404 RepID=UPI002BBEB6FF|nr:hypothetical protein [Edaphobacter sp.]HUZ97607.1 hypothetical protein [Edaphobacter sp.]
MALRKHRWALLIGCLLLLAATVRSQVFVVGETTATDEISTHFTPTNLPLPDAPMKERGRRELVRMLVAEQGFAHCALPMGAGLTLRANGPLETSAAAYKEMVYKKGESAAPGDRVVVTALTVKGNRIILDLNGGPYEKHRFLRHVQFNDNPVVADTGEEATGSRVSLVFEGFVPDVSAPEVKSLLAPVIDFGVKTTEQAYANTLPPLVKQAVDVHEVLVGMNHRMVLAAMGEPESKIREKHSEDPSGAVYEEWIYGHEPQTIHFVKFIGDRVATVEIAALGKPLEIHNKDEMGGYNPPPPTREVAMGDQEPGNSPNGQSAPPTLRKPGEPIPSGGSGKVQFPTASQPTIPSVGVPTAGSPQDPHLL